MMRCQKVSVLGLPTIVPGTERRDAIDGVSERAGDDPARTPRTAIAAFQPARDRTNAR
jgi:hypothetical protein